MHNLAALFAAALFHGWFGPSSDADCERAYAEPAATKYLVAIARNECQSAFDERSHPIERARSLCVAAAIPQAKTDFAITLIRARCVDENPSPACSAGAAFNFESDRCEMTCLKDHVLDRKNNSCAWDCPPGWSPDESAQVCMPPKPTDDAAQAAESPPTVITYDGIKVAPPKKKRALQPQCQYSAVMSDAEMEACRHN